MKILSLDDHPLFSQGLKASLESSSLGCELIVANNAEVALQHLAGPIEIDLMLLDLSMPQIDGISFMSALSARRILVPVAVMSAEDDIRIIDKALKQGAVGFIPKTWTLDKLIEAIELMIKGHIVIPEKIVEALNVKSKRAEENTQTTLSKRQLEILKFVQAGLSNQAIAAVLCISEATVKSHLQAIFQILSAKNRVDCVRKAEHLNILRVAS